MVAMHGGAVNKAKRARLGAFVLVRFICLGGRPEVIRFRLRGSSSESGSVPNCISIPGIWI